MGAPLLTRQRVMGMSSSRDGGDVPGADKRAEREKYSRKLIFWNSQKSTCTSRKEQAVFLKPRKARSYRLYPTDWSVVVFETSDRGRARHERVTFRAMPECTLGEKKMDMLATVIYLNVAHDLVFFVVI